MMPEEQMRREIEQHERWLAGLGVEVEPPRGLEPIKHRVRTAVNEQWLADRPAQPPAQPDLAAVKRLVRAELQRSDSGDAPPTLAPAARMYQFVSTLAAAAALLLAAGLGLWSATSPRQERSAPQLDVAALVEVLARSPDEEETEWESIEDELVALETLLVDGFEDDYHEDLLDELDDEIDDWINEFSPPADIS